MRHVLLFLDCLDKVMVIVLDKSNPNSNLDILGIHFSRALHIYGSQCLMLPFHL